jgi:hypothetical protein
MKRLLKNVESLTRIGLEFMGCKNIEYNIYNKCDESFIEISLFYVNQDYDVFVDANLPLDKIVEDIKKAFLDMAFAIELNRYIDTYNMDIQRNPHYDVA